LKRISTTKKYNFRKNFGKTGHGTSGRLDILVSKDDSSAYND
jgi:hypothetical protein